MEPEEESPRDGMSINRTMDEWYQLPAEEDSSQLPPQEVTPHGAPSSLAGAGTRGLHPPPHQTPSLQLEFQDDSQMSPMLSLLPVKSRRSFSDTTLFQQTDLEFAPLRASPDYSAFSERLSMLPLVGGATDIGVAPPSAHSTAISHYESLSQHPLEQADQEGSSCSLSQHSMSPGDRYQVTPGRESEAERDSAEDQGYERRGEGEEEDEERSAPRGREEKEEEDEEEDDDGSFLNSSIPARTLLEMLEKDVGVVSSSSAVSSASDTVFSQPELAHKQTDGTPSQSGHSWNRTDSNADKQPMAPTQRPSSLFQTGPSATSLVRSTGSDIFLRSSSGGSTEEEPSRNPPAGVRECPQGDASVSPPQPAPPTANTNIRTDRRAANRSLSSQQLDSSNLSNVSVSGRGLGSRTSDISNITFRSAGSRPDAATDALRSQLLSESRMSFPGPRSPRTSPEDGSPPEPQPGGGGVGGGGSAAGRPVVLQTPSNFAVERSHRERLLWQSGNQMGVDASFLTSQPHPAFQSTPSVLPLSGRARAEMLIGAGASSSYSPPPSQSPVLHGTDALVVQTQAASRTTRTSTTPPVGAAEVGSSSSSMSRGLLTGSEVGSLPSLSYVQKVDAWRANQSSNRAFGNELELQGSDEDVNVQQQRSGVNSNVVASMAELGGSGNQNLLTPYPQPREDSGAEGSVGGEAGAAGVGGVVAGGGGGGGGGGTGGGGGGGSGGGTGTAGLVSPAGRSHSYSSSLGTVVTSIQHQGTAARPDDITAEDPAASREEVGPLGEAEEAYNQNGQQRSRVITMGHFSDVSSTRDTGNSPLDSFLGEGSMTRASLGGASSVVSLEVDNYAPYWTSIPSTPNRERELNIEDRIPLYLKNLGINQSPSTILTPFAPRGPIREPEFSPTDLCTIKGSTGTPTKSTQASEGESPDKGEFSALSQGSSGSVSLSTGRPMVHLSDPDRPTSQGSVRMSRSFSRTPPESPVTVPAPFLSLPTSITAAAAPHQTTSSGAVKESGQAATPLLQPSTREEASQGGAREAQASQLAHRSPRRDQLHQPQQQQQQQQQPGEDWLVGSRTLQEIRQLLGRAESVISLRSSLATSTGSDSSLLQSLRRKMEDPAFQNASLSSSGGGLWGRSSSDSMLRDSSASLSSDPTRALLGGTFTPPTTSADLSGVPGIRESVRRAEPEGATDPDRAAPPPALQPITQVPALNSNAPPPLDQEEDEEAETTPVGQEEPSPAHSAATEAEVASVSDGSEFSHGSLGARVARLLQEESPVSMVTSRASTTDTDESRAREWILLKATGKVCEPLNLNTEDRQRIDEIKRELLQHTKSQYSSDSDGSAPSSLGVGLSSSAPLPPPPPASYQHVEGFRALRSAEERLSDQLQRAAARTLLESRGAAGTTTPSYPPPSSSQQAALSLRPSLEARVEEIAQREGHALHLPPPSSSATSHRSLSPSPHLTSITIGTSRRSPSPPSRSSPLLPPPHRGLLQAESTTSVSTQTQTQRMGTLLLQTHTPSQSDTESDRSLSLPDHHSHHHHHHHHHDDSALSLSQHTITHPSSLTPTHTPGVEVSRLGAELEVEEEEMRRTELRVKGQERSHHEVTEGWDNQSVATTTPLPAPTGRHVSTQLQLTLSPKPRAKDSAEVAEAADKSASHGGSSLEAHNDSRMLSGALHTDAILSTSWQRRPSVDAQYGRSEDVAHWNNQESASLPNMESRQLNSISEPLRPAAPEQSMTSVIRSVEPGRCPQSFTPPQRLTGPSPRPTSVYAPVAPPTLLPYKPHGSSELFYVPKTDSTLPSPQRSDTTIESTHTGSDDAVPPRFTVDVLGSRDLQPAPALPTHTEGIYSKSRGSSSVSWRAPPVGERVGRASVSGRRKTEEEERPEQEDQEEEFRPLPMELDLSMASMRRHSSPLRDQDLPLAPSPDVRQSQPITAGHPLLRGAGAEQQVVGQSPGEIGSTLDQLWRRFSERWSQEQSRLANSSSSVGVGEREEASLLERLERLSRLINSSSLTHSSSTLMHALTHPTPSTSTGRDTLTTTTQVDSTQTLPQKKKQADPAARPPGTKRVEKGGKSKKKERRAKEDRKGTREDDDRVKRGGPLRLAWAEPETQESSNQMSEEQPGVQEEEEGAPLVDVEQEEEEPERLGGGGGGRCPAERDSSMSTETSLSTIDTQRLLRAFGPKRVKTLGGAAAGAGTAEKGRESLLKLYSNIHKQRSCSTSTTTNDYSTVTLDSSSSGSSLPPRPRATTKRSKVKQVSRGVQAGDLEIVSNGTRRNTRDVGTTFPSPHPSSSASSSAASTASSLAQRSQHGLMKDRHSKKPAPQAHPHGVSWFVPAEELRLDSRKENCPDASPEPTGSSSTSVPDPAAPSSWFEPYSRTRPWGTRREPLRERQNQEDQRGTAREPRRSRGGGSSTAQDGDAGLRQHGQRERGTQVDGGEEAQAQRHQQLLQQLQSWVQRQGPQGPRTGAKDGEKSSEISGGSETSQHKIQALKRLTLQEALEFRRPGFVSRSRERLKRLCLLREERRMQAEFNRERELLFNNPPLQRRLTHNTAVPARPIRRAVPKKEMFQRSKQIYAQLPEVAKRREEERRRVEYRSYRLNAQLFNKKVTNRVLGRRTPWQ